MKKLKVTSRLNACLLGAAIMFSTGTAYADGDKDPAVEYRHSVMEVILWNSNYFFGMLTGKVEYDAEQAKMRAANIKALSTMPWEAFTAESRGKVSHALDAVWSDPEGFQAAVDAFEAAVIELEKVAGDGEAAAKLATAKMGGTCTDCHDKYREEE